MDVEKIIERARRHNAMLKRLARDFEDAEELQTRFTAAELLNAKADAVDELMLHIQGIERARELRSVADTLLLIGKGAEK